MSEENKERIITDETESKASKNENTSKNLAIISLVLLGVHLLSFSFNFSFLRNIPFLMSGTAIINRIIYYLNNLKLLIPVASIVLMIISRVMNPKNKMAKVLMWVWIVLGVIEIALYVLAVFLIVTICSSLFAG